MRNSVGFSDPFEKLKRELFTSSVHPPSMSYGVYWVKKRQTWWPGGAKVGSRLEGMVISIMGTREGWFSLTASRYARSSISVDSQFRWMVQQWWGITWNNQCNPSLCQVTKSGLFFGHSKKNSRCKKLKTQEKNSKLKLKIQISGTFEEKRRFLHWNFRLSFSLTLRKVNWNYNN